MKSSLRLGGAGGCWEYRHATEAAARAELKKRAARKPVRVIHCKRCDGFHIVSPDSKRH